MDNSIIGPVSSLHTIRFYLLVLRTPRIHSVNEVDCRWNSIGIGTTKIRNTRAMMIEAHGGGNDGGVYPQGAYSLYRCALCSVWTMTNETKYSALDNTET